RACDPIGPSREARSALAGEEGQHVFRLEIPGGSPRRGCRTPARTTGEHRGKSLHSVAVFPWLVAGDLVGEGDAERDEPFPGRAADRRVGPGVAIHELAGRAPLRPGIDQNRLAGATRLGEGPFLVQDPVDGPWVPGASGEAAGGTEKNRDREQRRE